MKATISKVIDGLIAESAVKRPVGSGPTALARDDLIELEGLTRITSASHFGKMFFILRRVFEGANLADLEDLATTFTESDLQDGMAQVYLRNELLPIPVLLELEGSALPHRVYVNVDPNHFVDSASADHVEGDLRVLGTVSRLIDGSSDGYFSAEQWLMSGWETFLRRTFMAQIDDALDALREAWAAAGVTLPREDVSAYISGPAIVVNAIALY